MNTIKINLDMGIRFISRIRFILDAMLKLVCCFHLVNRIIIPVIVLKKVD